MKPPTLLEIATGTDNPHIPQSYRDSLKNLPEREYKRFVEGDWSFISGAFAVPTRKRKASPEHDEQVRLFEAIDAHPQLRDALIYAVPNAGGYVGSFKANVVRASRMRDEGVRRGPPDINVDEPRKGYHGLRIEMKIGKNKPSPEQRDWIEKLNARGYMAVVCYSAAEAWAALIEYMGVKAGPLYTQPQFPLSPSPSPRSRR